MQLIRNLALLVVFCLGITMCRAQIILGGDSIREPVKIDYTAPKAYEIGGITSSGSAPLDQRLLPFHVGDIIEVPGDKISKAIKSLWNTGLYEDVEITATRVQGNLIFLDIRL